MEALEYIARLDNNALANYLKMLNEQVRGRRNYFGLNVQTAVLLEAAKRLEGTEDI